MISYYFRVALKNLSRTKIFTIISIAGLSIGISASLVVYLVANYQFSFDKFEQDRRSIYRVVTDYSFSGQTYHSSDVPFPLADVVEQQIKGVIVAAPFYIWEEDLKIIPAANGQLQLDNLGKEKNIVFTDVRYLNLIGYHWLAGSAKTALSEPYKIVLVESKAKHFFPNLSPFDIVGKTLIVGNTMQAVVSGVVSDIDKNTDFNFKILISRTTLERSELRPHNWTEWNSIPNNSQLFLKISNHVPPKLVEKDLHDVFEKRRDKNNDDGTIKTIFKLQSLNELHFDPDYSTYGVPKAYKPTLYSLMYIAGFLLLLGCLNFINLTTARAAEKNREIGIRKTLGGRRAQLVMQSFIETFVLTVLATFTSIALAPIIINNLSEFVAKDFQIHFILDGKYFLFVFSLTLVVAIFSGYLPALMLSRYKPALLLKNVYFEKTEKSLNTVIRKILSTFQFTIAQLFIILTLLVTKQIIFMVNKDEGFKKDAILSFYTSPRDTVSSHKPVLINRIKSFPEVSMVSLCMTPPSTTSNWTEDLAYNDGKSDIKTNVILRCGDSEYLKLYGIRLIAGSNIESSDTLKSFIINETYSRALGFANPRQAIGKVLRWESKMIPITGIVADFNQVSLHETIKPLAIFSQSRSEFNISVLLWPSGTHRGTWRGAISKIENAWKNIYPDDEFVYTFFDSDIAEYYKTEKNMARLLTWASGLAVFISCLGLLGLVIHTTNCRTKELGVRKVLGASTLQNVIMLWKEFIALIIVSFAIAAPIGYAVIQKWLQGFAYRTTPEWWLFLSSLAIMLFIPLVTVSYRTITVALSNPVKSLRAE